jgi:hypothetical protein
MEAINVKYHIISPVEHLKQINVYGGKVMLVVKAWLN